MMHDWGTGGWLTMFIMGFFWLLVLAGIVVLVIWLVNQNKSGTTQNKESAIEILRKRYAQGEITKEQFEDMKKDLI